ncbi:FERM and PDZ domain-containing protein 2 [Hoplias malabaricus]|uniref:FERM and PDZ domain-containing protein 2 n=1 Tax=Hoplias malabaricus TaxID=27720 RepID=UPI00346344C5
MSTFVTLAEVLESRGAPLEEAEVWALLLRAAEALLGVSSEGPSNPCSIISPGSILLSPNGSVAFKTCGRSEDVASFTSPEASRSHSRTSSSKQDLEKMAVFSLGMTLYWTVDYQLPQNQPVQLSTELNVLLLRMCEEAAHRRPVLLEVLRTSERHRKRSLLPPVDAVIRQLALDVLQDPAENPLGNSALLTDRSQLVRDRLRESCGRNSAWAPKGNGSPSLPLQTESNRNSNPRGRSSGGGTWLSPQINSKTQPQPFGSMLSLSERKLKDMGPEFVRMLDEPFIILELPNSIVSKKGKSCSTQRDLRVMMPNGQIILVKCDVKSRGGDVFDMIIAHANLVEHFYFGLAYREYDEFFFLDNETKISKVAPESWKKVPTSTFVLHFRIKFFISDTTLLLHNQTRHQYYLQLRRDIIEDRLPCNEETGLVLAALALQAEFGNSLPEVYGKNYYRPEHYVSKSVLEKVVLPCLREQLLRLHANNANTMAEESELEFLKTAQQLPEYGVLMHRVAREKKPHASELLLGVCTKGVIVYEVKNNSLSAKLRFLWRDIVSISVARRKFVIESSIGKKKHTFHMEKSRIARYLCDLCTVQHKFHKEMTSRQLSHSLNSEESIVQYAAVCRAQNHFGCSEGASDDSRVDNTHQESMSKLCDDIANRIETRIKQQRDLLEQHSATSPVFQRFLAGSQKRSSDVPSLSSVLLRDTPTSPRAPEREIICVNLRKDPKLGLGILIVGEDSTGRLDLGIFIASVVPGGPADRDRRIKPGGRLISLNQSSLEGVSFSEAAEIIQNSPKEVELIISQSKAKKAMSDLLERNYDSQSTLRADSRADDSLDELVTMMMTPKSGSRLHVPDVRILNAQDDYSRSASLISLRPEEFSVQLKKVSGSLGISVAGDLRSGGISVKGLVPGGAAQQDGRIQTDDRLLEVDGSRTQGFSNHQVAECLANTGDVVSLVLERDSPVIGRNSLSPEPCGTLAVQTAATATATQYRNNSCPAITMTTPFAMRPNDYSFVSEENTLEVTLRKRLNGLGFSFLIAELDTSLDCGSLVRVKTLFPGQAAEESGLIREGDVILAVNGESLKGQSYQRVLYLLKGSTPEVKLLICRPAPGILPPISEKIGQLTCS